MRVGTRHRDAGEVLRRHACRRFIPAAATFAAAVAAAPAAAVVVVIAVLLLSMSAGQF